MLTQLYPAVLHSFTPQCLQYSFSFPGLPGFFPFLKSTTDQASRSCPDQAIASRLVPSGREIRSVGAPRGPV